MRIALRNVRVALVIAPHPDDEVIGAAGLIARLRRHGARVRVAVVTDGAASHRGSRQWPRARLVAARQRESLHALRRLGIVAGDVSFLNLPDGQLPSIPGRCYRALRRQVARCRDLDLIVGPACDDDHPDHRAVAAAVAGCPGGAGRLTYRVWPPRPDRSGPAWRIAVPGGVPVKRSLIRVYRTQLGAVSDDPAGFTIARHELAAFARPVERYRPGSK